MLDLARRVTKKLLWKRAVARHLFDSLALSPSEAEARKSADPGPLETLFFANQGKLAHKWISYLPFYDEMLAPYRGKPIKMLEIGVFRGGSLELWRNYFGPQATIYGIDNNPECAGFADPPSQVRIGSQADPDFLRRVVDEMGAPDIVLDDGSHVASHQLASFRTLFPLLKNGGLYIIEDMHTSYWPEHEGGYGRRGTAVDLTKTLIDDMHAWHHLVGSREVFAPKEEIGRITVEDSIVALRKVARLRPGHYKTGG